jgi:hypothetical protein
MRYPIRAATLATTVLVAIMAMGCASGPRPVTDARIPAAQNYDVRIQPARISPNPQGAFGLSTATGCDVIYIARASATDTVTYAVRPTSRVPDAADCATRLGQQPGVETITKAL